MIKQCKYLCRLFVVLFTSVSLLWGAIAPSAIALNLSSPVLLAQASDTSATQGPDLPLPDPDFTDPDNNIKRTYVDSTPDFGIMEGPKPPDGSPNVLLVLLDDVGFAASHAFGGEIHSPTLDKLVANGLSYNRFHTTSLCAPTRAALLTGRNHHSAAAGNIAEHATGFPGYSGLIPQSTATIAQILQANGYSTSWFGKNHNAPDNQTSMVGPFNRMPNGLGFDYFYGFNAGETDQWYPTLYENFNPIAAPGAPPEYNLTRDLADQAINWIKYHNSLAPDIPFFMYFAPGATHAPHQPPQEYVQKYQAGGERAIAAGVGDTGMFTDGWDELHTRICDRLITSDTNVGNTDVAGLVPDNTDCTARPQAIQLINADGSDGEQTLDLHPPAGVEGVDWKYVDLIPAWNTLATEVQDSNSPFYTGDDRQSLDDHGLQAAKDLLTLEMQNYAGFFEYTDEQVGRVIEAIEDLGLDDNTIVMYIVGDNGASAEGGFPGSYNEFNNLSGLYPTMEENLDFYDEMVNNSDPIKSVWGGTTTSPHYAVGWAWALDTPFRWTKKIGSYFGGTRNPMVVYWKGNIESANPGDSIDRATNVRNQFIHAIDVTPTLLDLINIDAPVHFNGIEQKPMEGKSFANTFSSQDSNSATNGSQVDAPRDTQYFEMYANRGVYHQDESGEWVASTIHQVPWTGQGVYPFEPGNDPWELFKIDDDFTQSNDLSQDSTQYALKLEEMKVLFEREADEYDVYPLDDRVAERAGSSNHPTVLGDRTDFTFYEGATRLPESSAPDTKNKSHTITAQIAVTDNDGDGDIDADDFANLQGVVLANGAITSGYTIYIKDDDDGDKAVFYDYNYFDLDRYSISVKLDSATLSNPFTINFGFIYDTDGDDHAKALWCKHHQSKIGCGGTASLEVNGASDSIYISKTVPARFGVETQDVGMDLMSPASENYEPPFTFQGGSIDYVNINLAPDLSETSQSTDQLDDVESELSDLTAALDDELVNVKESLKILIKKLIDQL